MTVSFIRPDMGSRADQMDALDRALLEIAASVRALEAENRELNTQITSLAAKAAGLENQFMFLAGSPQPATGSQGLHLAWSAQ